MDPLVLFGVGALGWALLKGKATAGAVAAAAADVVKPKAPAPGSATPAPPPEEPPSKPSLGPLSRAEVDAKFGPLKPGVDYTEGKGGRIVPTKAWEIAHITSTKLHTGKVVQINKLLAAEFARVFKEAALASGYTPKSVQTYVPRHILWNPLKNLSYHSYGIAVDFDPSQNPYGDKPSLVEKYPKFIEIFEANGWVWGGRWSPGSRDKMHFERTGRKPIVG